MSDKKANKKNVKSLDEAKKKREKQKIQANILKQTVRCLPVESDALPVQTIDEHNIFEKAAELPPSHDAEIAELLCQRYGLHPSESVGFKKTIQQIRDENAPGKQKNNRGTKDYATLDDYLRLFQEQLGPLKRDVFSDNLMYLDKHSYIWLPAANEANRLMSVADDQNILLKGQQPTFKTTMIKAHLRRLESELAPIVIPTVPQWDGKDRIKTISACLVLDKKNPQPGYTPELVEYALKYWCSGVFRKIKDRFYQNPCLIFLGPQNIGKDTLIRALTGGFGQWACDFSVFSNEKDTLEQLNDSAVLRIGEFDRTSRVSIALLKHIITADHTKLRSSYDPRSAYRITRCSFISSCNIHDIYRDHTGSRRYLPINLEKIHFNYGRSEEDMKQVLAQSKRLAEQEFNLKEEHRDAISAFLSDMTPSDPEDDALEAWENVVENYMEKRATSIDKDEVESRGWLTNAEISEHKLIKAASQQVGWNEKRLRELLRRKGLDRRTNTAKGYAAQTIIRKTLPVTNLDDEIPF